MCPGTGSVSTVFLQELQKQGLMDDLTSMEARRPRECAGCSPRRVWATFGLQHPKSGTSEGHITTRWGLKIADSREFGLPVLGQREILFRLYPERWLGTQADPVNAELVDSEDLPVRTGDHQDSEPESKLSHRHIALPPGSKPRDPEATPRSVVAWVVDYQVKEEVLRTAWTMGQMTMRTEEHSGTTATFAPQGSDTAVGHQDPRQTRMYPVWLMEDSLLPKDLIADTQISGA